MTSTDSKHTTSNTTTKEHISITTNEMDSTHTSHVSGCSSCSSKSSCGLGFFQTLFPRKHATPDTVLSEAEVLSHTFMLYIVPIVLLLAGSGLAEFIFPDNALIALVFALSGFVCGVGIIFLKKNITRT